MQIGKCIFIPSCKKQPEKVRFSSFFLVVGINIFTFANKVWSILPNLVR